MSETKHTPSFHECGCIPRRDQSVQGNTIQFCALHTAAPDLLEAAKAILFAYGKDGNRLHKMEAWEQLRAAIAKAEPEPKRKGRTA